MRPLVASCADCCAPVDITWMAEIPHGPIFCERCTPTIPRTPAAVRARVDELGPDGGAVSVEIEF